MSELSGALKKPRKEKLYDLPKRKTRYSEKEKVDMKEEKLRRARKKKEATSMMKWHLQNFDVCDAIRDVVQDVHGKEEKQPEEVSSSKNEGSSKDYKITTTPLTENSQHSQPSTSNGFQQQYYQERNLSDSQTLENMGSVVAAPDGNLASKSAKPCTTNRLIILRPI